jgi:uncharacterized membrane protein YqjE
VTQSVENRMSVRERAKRLFGLYFLTVLGLVIAAISLQSVVAVTVLVLTMPYLFWVCWSLKCYNCDKLAVIYRLGPSSFSPTIFWIPKRCQKCGASLE